MTADRESVRKVIQQASAGDFRKIRDFLNKRPMASVMDVTNGTGVASATIMEFVNAGVLKIRNSRY